ncbi:YitT family protein, partial [Klebsiella pneumoniae]|uniref:YitT family protein n=1 Tax=Klebsiella pneumoniae TaxID=573 RepID=UPI0025A1D6C2
RSVLTDLLAFFPAASTEPLLSSICGGAMMGAGAGIMLMRGYTTGGSDLAAYLVRRRIRRLPVGTLILMIDAVIIIGAALLQGRYDGI